MCCACLKCDVERIILAYCKHVAVGDVRVVAEQVALAGLVGFRLDETIPIYHPLYNRATKSAFGGKGENERIKENKIYIY